MGSWVGYTPKKREEMALPEFSRHYLACPRAVPYSPWETFRKISNLFTASLVLVRTLPWDHWTFVI